MAHFHPAYWTLDFGASNKKVRLTQRLSRLPEAVSRAADRRRRIRLRADVPVGAYLSGGLDSSTLAAVVRRFTDNHLETFSIAFSDPQFDESDFQIEMARALGTEHHVVRATHADIGRVFPDVVWHAESPMTRTAPAPMFLLSRLVHQCEPAGGAHGRETPTSFLPGDATSSGKRRFAVFGRNNPIPGGVLPCSVVSMKTSQDCRISVRHSRRAFFREA
jgi:hypothetical protein